MDFSRLKDIFFHKILEINLSDCKTVLDVGCGYESQLARIKKSFFSEGIDIWAKDVKRSRARQLHDSYKIGDIRNLSSHYREKSFDAVIALDVVEHFNKKEAKKIMEQMEIIARKKVLILTPNGFIKQEKILDNPYQIHKSGWKCGEFKRLGYKVYGLRGLKMIFGDSADIKRKPKLFWSFFVFISEILLYFFPELSFDLFSVKKINNFAHKTFLP